MSDPAPYPAPVRITLTDEDWIAANWLVIRHAWLWRKLMLLFGAVWLIYILLLVVPGVIEYGWNTNWALRGAGQSALIAAFLVALLVGLTAALTPRRVRKQLADTRRLTSGYDLTVSPEGVRSASDIGEVNMRWGQFKRWHENARLIALVITDREVLVIPKTQLDPGTIGEVRERLVAAQVERGLT